MKFKNIEDACHNLRQMGKQFICPKDEFFGPLADFIERQRQCLHEAEETNILLARTIKSSLGGDGFFGPLCDELLEQSQAMQHIFNKAKCA